MIKELRQNFRVEPEAYVGTAVFLLAAPLRWLLAWLLAAAAHELFHCIALLVCGKQIYGIHVGLNGTVIQTTAISGYQMVFCAFAGPFGGLLLLSLSSVYPELALCALIQTAFNLLPVHPLDGGRILYGLVEMIFPYPEAKRICSIFRWVIFILIFASCIVAAVVFHTYFILLIPAVLFLRTMQK